MSGEDDDYFSSIGNMYSGSYDPEEQNRAAEREAEGVLFASRGFM